MSRPAPKTVRRRFFVALSQAIHLTWPVLSAILAIQVALGLVIGFVEGWSVGDAIYFTFITGLTIGYGDIVPMGGLVGYWFGPVILQGYLTTDVYEKNYGGKDVRAWTRIVIPLGNPSGPSPGAHIAY